MQSGIESVCFSDLNGPQPIKRRSAITDLSPQNHQLSQIFPYLETSSILTILFNRKIQTRYNSARKTGRQTGNKALKVLCNILIYRLVSIVLPLPTQDGCREQIFECVFFSRAIKQAFRSLPRPALYSSCFFHQEYLPIGNIPLYNKKSRHEIGIQTLQVHIGLYSTRL